METKKHLQARKKVEGAVNTFSNAAAEVDKAIELLNLSLDQDFKTIKGYEDQIKSLSQAIDEVTATTLKKQAEIKANAALSLKLKEFSV